MQERIKRYAEEARHAHGVNIQVRVGLNSGEVVVRAIGSDLHMDYTAVGQTTHLAARMEQLASPGSILLTPSTLELVEGYLTVRPLGPVPVKGLAEAVEVYEATGAGPARTRLQAAVRRGLTRFVGRDAEMEQLRRAQQLADNGHGQLVAVVGEAGVGKSRLVYEFTHSHRLQGWLVLEGASVSYGKATSYLPLIELLKAYFKIVDRDHHREMREKITGKLFTLDESLRSTLPALLALFDLPVDDAAWARLDTAQRRQRTLDAVKRVLLRESQVQPVLLILEDLHWIDAETQGLLDSLVDSLGSARLLLVVNYRLEYQHLWGKKTYYTQMRLDALPAESAGDLLEALLGDDPGLAPLKQLLVKRGNPFFLEETVRTLVETKALSGERGRYRLIQPVQAIQVPATVQAILAARIDRLSPEDKRLLQVASVLGKDFPYALLQAIAELSEEALRHGLDRLQAAEFLYETGLFPDLEYSFKHALTHEVTYASLLHDRQRVLHARIVEAIEALYPERLAEQAERLAHHAVRGEIWDKAVRYLSQAGAKAFAGTALREAARYFEQALAALAHLPETRENLQHAVELRLSLRNSLFPLGEFEAGLNCLREGEPLAGTLDDQHRLGRIWAYMSEHARVHGHTTDACTLAQRVYAIAQRLRDVPLTVTANYYLGTAYLIAGEFCSACEFLENTTRTIEDDFGRERFGMAGYPAVMARVFWVWALAERGKFEEALVHGRDAVRLAEALEHPYSLAFAYLSLGRCFGLKGDLPHATELLERSVAILREWNNLVFLTSLVPGNLGYVYALAGRIPEGLELLQAAMPDLENMGFTMFTPPLMLHLGEVRVLAGQPDMALGLAERALALARERGQRGPEAWALRLQGDAAAYRDPQDVEVAERGYRDAITLSARLGMRPLTARCYLGLGTLFLRSGRRDLAHEQLTAASTMFREMDMQFWLAKAESALKEL